MSQSDRYYVIRTTEDGDTLVSEHTREDLEQKLAEEYWGEGDRAPKWLDNVGNIGDEECAFIIKGTIVQPKDVVKSWGLP